MTYYRVGLRDLIDRALKEDIGPGDVTTTSIVPGDQQGAGEIIAKGRGIVAGLDVAHQVFLTVDPKVKFEARL